MIETVQTRAARAADLAELRRLWLQADRFHAELHPDYFSREGLARSHPPRDLTAQLNGKHQRVIVAVDRDAATLSHPPLLGAVRVRIYDTSNDPLLVRSRRSHIEYLVVDQPHRRRGIGRLLLGEAQQWGRRCGATKMLLTVWERNTPAIDFYQRLGFTPLNRVLEADLEP